LLEGKTMTLRINRHLELRQFLSLAALSALTIGLATLCVPATASAAAPPIVVHPGDSIQAAVDAAPAGSEIILMPGTYYGPENARRAVRIKQDGISLIGKPDGADKVILRPNPDGSNEDGILVEPEGGSSCDCMIEGSRIQGITVEGFPGNGIKLEFVNHFKILDNESIDNLENGIQPELSANGLVKNNLSYGSNDSALWIEGGTNVRVINNVTHSSVTGLEVTISKNVVIVGNESYNNTIGMGLYHPSGASEPPLEDMGDLKVLNNYIHDNNRDNTAPGDPNGGGAASLPKGGGILLNGISENLLEGNLVTNNDFFGLAVIGYCLGQNEFPGNEAPFCASNRSGIDPVPRDNKIQENVFVDNGLHPPDHELAFFAADIIEGYVNLPFPGSEPTAGNCYEDNSYTTYWNFVDFGATGPPQCDDDG
jgi:hypothetical protein